MKLSQSDFPHIKWSLLAFALSIVIGASAVWVSNNFATETLRSRQAAEKHLSEVKNKLATAKVDEENMTTYAQEYLELEKRKVIGSEQRLDWIEDLENLRKQGYVLDFKYTVSPQQTYTAKPPVDTGNYDTKLSNMSLQFDLLHEGQLMRFFEALRTNLNGCFIIDHCSLERVATEPAGTGANLKADCTGGWLTIKNRSAS